MCLYIFNEACENFKLYMWFHLWLALHFSWTALACTILLRSIILKKEDNKQITSRWKCKVRGKGF